MMSGGCAFQSFRACITSCGASLGRQLKWLIRLAYLSNSIHDAAMNWHVEQSLTLHFRQALTKDYVTCTYCYVFHMSLWLQTNDPFHTVIKLGGRKYVPSRSVVCLMADRFIDNTNAYIHTLPYTSSVVSTQQLFFSG